MQKSQDPEWARGSGQRRPNAMLQARQSVISSPLIPSSVSVFIWRFLSISDHLAIFTILSLCISRYFSVFPLHISLSLFLFCLCALCVTLYLQFCVCLLFFLSPLSSPLPCRSAALAKCPLVETFQLLEMQPTAALLRHCCASDCSTHSLSIYCVPGTVPENLRIF